MYSGRDPYLLKVADLAEDAVKRMLHLGLLKEYADLAEDAVKRMLHLGLLKEYLFPSYVCDPDSCRAELGTNEGNTKTSAAWFVATPALHHGTGNYNCNLLSGFVTVHDDLFVHAVDEKPMEVLAHGTVVTDTEVLPDLWYAPRLTENLVPISQLSELYYGARFIHGEWCFRGFGDGAIGVTAHHRGIDSAFKDDFLQMTQRFVHMMNGAEGTIDQPMHDVSILDSGAVLHCTGDRNLLSEYKEQLDGSIRGASGKVMPVIGVGSINNERFQVKDVKHIPTLNQPNINKTIFSVSELGKLGYSVHFNGASCVVMDNRNRSWSWKTWTWTHEVVGEAHLEHKLFMVDYLRIPADRTPATKLEGPKLMASFWKTASSGWTSITRLVTQKPSAQRLPV